MAASKTSIYQQIEQGQFEQAVVELQAYCRMRPRDPEAHYLLGQALGRLGRLDEAKAAFHRVIALQPDAAVGHGGLGSVLHRQGRFQEAAEALRKACQLLPEDREYRLELVTCLERANLRQDAFQECRALLELDPEYARGYCVLGSLCCYAQQYDAATGHYHQALEHAPDMLEAHIGLGKIHTTLGAHALAREHYETVLRQRPDHVEAIAGLALLHERCGELDEAYGRVCQLVDLGCHQTTIANVYTNLCGHYDACAEAVRYAEATLASLAEDHHRERQVLHYVLGRRYDKMGEYDKAFRHYQQANRQFPIHYDAAAHADLVTGIIRTFSPAFMMTAPRAGDRSNRPVFIVGMPRSGTSLLEQVLASHPEVAAGGELENISDMVAGEGGIIASKGGYPGGVPELNGAQLDALAQSYHAHLREISTDARHVTDKMPHNFMALGLIALLFPGARVIHCTRDPLDTCLSIYFQDFTRHHDYALDLENIGTHYRQYQRLMRHWRNVLDIPMLDVAYQDLVRDQEATTRRLLDFCGLEWDPACLAFHRSERVVNTASYSQVRQPMHSGSVERWRHYERHLDGLKDALERDY